MSAHLVVDTIAVCLPRQAAVISAFLSPIGRSLPREAILVTSAGHMLTLPVSVPEAAELLRG